MPPLLLLGPGASGGTATLRPLIRALGDAGLPSRAVTLPQGKAERAIPKYAGAVGRARGARPLLAGGHSFGGRVASLLAAEEVERGKARIDGLVLLSYPLHAPGRAEAWDTRTEHWPRLRMPILLLSGESDPFARIDLLRAAVRDRLGDDAELVTYPGVGHGLWSMIPEVVARITEFAARVGDTGR